MRSSDFHSNPLFLLLVIFSNKLRFGLKFSVLEIFFFFWKVYTKSVKQFIYVSTEKKKPHKNISMHVLIRYFLLNELKISYSKEFPNFACVYPQEV